MTVEACLAAIDHNLLMMAGGLFAVGLFCALAMFRLGIEVGRSRGSRPQ